MTKTEKAAYNLAWNRRNRLKRRKYSRLYRKRRADYIRACRSQACADCGNDYPWYVMEFDHVRGSKIRTIAAMSSSVGMTKLKEEIAKCDVVCANCHAVRTFKRRQQYQQGKPGPSRLDKRRKR